MLVALVKKNLLQTIQNQLLERWLLDKESEITKKAESEVRAREIDLIENEVRSRGYGNKIAKSEDPPRTVNRHGYAIYARFAYDFQLFIYPVKQKIKQDYQKEFYCSIWRELEKKFADAIDALEPEKAEEQFFERHDWVNKKYLDQSSIPYQFLYSYLDKRLLATLTSGPLIQWSSAKASDIEGRHFQWASFSKEWLDKYVESYPYLDVKAMYVVDVRKDYRNYLVINNSLRLGIERLNLPPSRIDVFRFLYNQAYVSMSAEEQAGISITPHVPLHINELEKLKSAHWKVLNSLFINIHTEEEPVWVFIKKAKIGWVGYLPPTGSEKQKKLLSSTLALQGITFVDVNHANNLKLNDVRDLSPVAQWHAVLFGRIAPWHFENSMQPLERFRDKVPVPVLHQKVLEQCMHGNNSYSSEAIKQVRRAALNRKPFSELSWLELNPLSEKKSPNYLLDTEYALDAIEANGILDGFDKNELDFSSDLTTLTVQPDSFLHADIRLIQALHLVYHHAPVRLMMSSMPLLDKTNKNLFNLDINLRTVKPLNSYEFDKARFSYPMHCAARNRFLQQVKPALLQAEKISSSMRKRLWKEAGSAMVLFFQQHGSAIDLDFINEAEKSGKRWREHYCDHDFHTSTSSTIWSFLQLAQMGKEGLDELFTVLQAYSGDSDSKDPSPNLPCTLDLHGSLTDGPHEYIAYLADKIRNYYPKSAGHTPLFKTLSLILPNNLDGKTSQALMDLITTLNERKKRFPQEVSEVNLYNLKNPSINSSFLMEALSTKAKNSDLQIQINIPAWNRDAYTARESQVLKAAYRQVQNSIVENQRRRHHEKLKDNTATIYLCADKKLNPELILDTRLAQEAQSFEGEDVLYPLTAQIPGIQQQLQQQVGKAFKAEQKEEQKEQQEQEQQIMQFSGDESQLITRDNIDQRGRQSWDALNAETKERSGWEKNTLRQLFSLWVGSDDKAPQVIEKIHPDAMQKIMAHAPQFRLGIAKDNLPAGFFLQYSVNKGLILCFDELRERKELRAEKLKPLKSRNPFTLQLEPVRPANEFRGDFRQFDVLNGNTTSQQTFWQYLAIEDKDTVRFENAKKLIAAKDLNQASVMLQYNDLHGQFKKPEEYRHCLTYLAQWSNSLKTRISPELRDVLLNDKRETVLSEKNLQSFGQLFNHYDIHGNKTNGSEHFLFLADQILKEFGENGFKVWKKRLLDASQNWSEILEKSEVDAIALSITTLRGFPHHQALWWKLVDAHGKAVGAMRYADLWYAFQRILSYIEERNLTLDAQSWTRLLDTSNNFNGQVFLDRLYRVLKDQRNQLDSLHVQQLTLNCLDKIDWHHNGFYYACRYQHFPYWDEGMALSQFTPATKAMQPGYTSDWDYNLELQFPTMHALRFASKRMQLSQKQWVMLKALLDEKLTSSHSQAIRLFIVSISLGVNHLDQVKRHEFEKTLQDFSSITFEFLQGLNEALSLDQELLPGTLRMRFQDIPVFAEVTGLNWSYFKTESRMSLINTFGRALHCFARLGNQKTLFNSLFEIAKQQGFHAPLVTTYPWLIEEAMKLSSWADPLQGASLALKKKTKSEEAFKQLQCFEKQLQSIDFDKNTYWPDTHELAGLFKAIAESSNPAETRRQIIAGLLQKQCAITLQDAPFRTLESNEVCEALQYLGSHLKPGYKNQNLELAHRFLQEYGAVKADTDAGKQLEFFLKLLSRLDNKAHFDELGQVLGTLILKAGKNSQRRYALPQLTGWLESLIDEKVLDLQHYPVNLLKVILDNALTQDVGLLHRDLNKLKETGPTSDLMDIRALVQEPLANQYKPVLVKLLLANTNSHFVKGAQAALGALHDAKVGSVWKEAITGFLEACQDSHLLSDRGLLLLHLTKLVDTLFKDADEQLKSLWQKTQVTLIDLVVNKSIPAEAIHRVFIQNSAKQAYIKIILLHALTDWSTEGEYAISVRDKLNQFSEEQLHHLACYYDSLPRPSLAMLKKLLAKPELKSTDDLIHHFESVEQGLTQQGQLKRHYSIHDGDRKELVRVLAGFKRKGQSHLDDQEQKQLINLLYYCNNFSQVASLNTLKPNELTATLYLTFSQHKTARTPADKHQASARLLACMREILLRKSGKWANHTQMLSLLYAALYNDESLLHQVRTGQGKSIITVMRSAYLALNGYVVDVFSSKDSLSKRDHEEFASVLDAMAIEHAYITEGSPANTYKTHSAPGIGAINYATIGNFSLFHSCHIWRGQEAIDLNPERRAAWLDEADYILREQTQFNYSDSRESDPIYNMDEWVYRATYDWYLNNRETFHQLKDTGIAAVSRKEHLQALCKYLQERIAGSPKQSHFVDKYIIPALDGDERALKKRDRQLKQLLTAAHIASNLTDGTDFCIRPDSRKVADELEIDTHAGKVVISNQIREGSTYSDLAQQFLHILLNKEAIHRGEIPDFFVDPDTRIALSQNVPYLLKKYYSKLEGCTATAGNAATLRFYREEYGIEHVSKLPTHEVLRTHYAPMVFCSSEEDQAAAIAEQIRQCKDRPVLHTCKDDPAVKRLSKKIRAHLEHHEDYDLTQFLMDTNDSGKQESDILPGAGLNGAVTNSSRLGRGTDIKPESEKGLLVIRSYPADPDIEKQERGRQGRNGARGHCIDIIDYSGIDREYQAYLKSPHRNRLEVLLVEQQQHVKQRLLKHAQHGSTKWDWLKDEDLQKKYVITRSVVQLNLEFKHDREKYLRRKEYLIATLSGEVMDKLHDAILDKDNDAHGRLCTAWLEHLRQIEDAWNGRLAGKLGDSDEVYTEFFKQADAVWQTLCVICPQLDTMCLLTLSEKTADLSVGNQGLLKYLEKQHKAWQEKLDAKTLCMDDKSALTQLKKQIQRLAVEWHPDKQSDKSTEEKKTAEDLIRVITALKEVRQDCEHAMEELEKKANPLAHQQTTVPHSPSQPLDGSSGALVLHRPSDSPIRQTQQHNMASVITFYQEWLKQTARHYLDSIASVNERKHVFDSVYGLTQQRLGTLYRELNLASASELNEDRRVQLFTQLTSCIKTHHSAFSVSCEAWA